MMGVASNRVSQISRDDQIIQVKQLVSWGIDGLLIHTRGDEGESERILDAVKGRVPVAFVKGYRNRVFASPTM